MIPLRGVKPPARLDLATYAERVHVSLIHEVSYLYLTREQRDVVAYTRKDGVLRIYVQAHFRSTKTTQVGELKENHLHQVDRDELALAFVRAALLL